MNIKFSTKPNLTILIASLILFIMTFIPWATASAKSAFFNISVSQNGFHSGGILTFIMSIAGCAAAFLEDKRTRYLGTMIAGVLALLGVVIFMGTQLGNGWGVNAGVILALIFSVCLVALGYMDYKNIPLPFKVGGTPKSNPPPPPPPPPAPPAQ